MDLGRRLYRRPWFTVVVVLMVALAAGAATHGRLWDRPKVKHRAAPPSRESSASSCMSTYEFVDAMSRIASVAQLGPAEPGSKVVCELGPAASDPVIAGQRQFILAASDPVIAGQRQFIVLARSEGGWNGDGPAGGPLTPDFCTSLRSDPVIWDFVREGC
jgi:hypothetical protein